ncbi:hypothetical protein [Pseudoxanthomonas sp.]|uniref:hypothetical protein n=1 Tax=Pseudoxanthomonas sp. TaxID=1871049 RepID=UPI00260C3FBF|nr:hypothetical protein [Pseudoxanthomonas sp.]WDS37080.1 MAG: hypothetical protein O8I58_04045 [Pseudoxanthomonas sp.]
MRNLITIAVLAALGAPAFAADDSAHQAVRADLVLGSDSDGNQTLKSNLGWDWRYVAPDQWSGVQVQDARFSGDGWHKQEQRVYLSGAGLAGAWRWEGDVGSNGHRLLGNASIHSEDAYRKEFFVERDVLETQRGVRNGWVQTYAGGALDLPLSERWSATTLAALQDFGVGDNLRSHLRANLVYALLPQQGISMQLRTRYYHDSHTGEGDYYAPGTYRQAMGVLAWRRYIGGTQWYARAGLGRQQSGDDAWRQARLLEFGVETPRWKQAWLRLDAGYTDTPAINGSSDSGYNYRYMQLQLRYAF